MKTIAELQSQEKSLVSDVDQYKIIPKGEQSKDRRERNGKLKRAKKNLSFIRLMINYVKTNPPEAYIRGEITRLNKRLSAIDKGYVHRRSLVKKELTLMQEKDMRKEYDKELGVPKIKLQLKTLKFILS